MDASPATIYGFNVRQMPIGGAIHFLLVDPICGVLHTTEGSLGSAVQAFHQHGDPPHFAVDSQTILQFRPLDERSMSLRHDPNHNIFKGHTNAHAIQLEIAGKSQTALWLPDDNAVARIAAVMAYASKFHNIPLIAPNNFPDDCGDMPLPWATRNARRVWAEANWPDVRGWWMHMEVPGQGNSWHWDCGAIRRSVLIQKAKEFFDGSVPP